MRSLKEECGVFGIWNSREAARWTYLGLYAIQHRGQEACGIVSLRNGEQHQHRGLGLVGDVFTTKILESLVGTAAIGHVRYSTTGVNHIKNAQPLSANLMNGPISLAHNGNIVNSTELKMDLQKKGAIFQGSNDSEIFLHLLAHHSSSNLIEALSESCRSVQGAFSLVVLSHDRLVAVRDPWGFRPLVLGKKAEGGVESFVIASETCAFDLIGAEYIREIHPGEIWWVDQDGEHSQYFAEESRKARCVFEPIYFSRPDSVVFGESVYASRKAFGRELAALSPVEADLVIPVPDSGVPAALGFAEKSGIPFEMGIIRNHYVGRTFIQPHQDIRDFGVKIKLNPQKSLIAGKRVVVVDDSLVRGTTSKKVINLLRDAGAKEVHVRIASPPTKGACYYGVDTPERAQLIAAEHDIPQIQDFIGADSLGYLSLEGMWKALKISEKSYCAACFDGDYPTKIIG